METGIVVRIDSPALGRVHSFELLTPDSRMLTFDTTELRAQADFPISHLGEQSAPG